jgi:hypothetical protein
VGSTCRIADTTANNNGFGLVGDGCGFTLGGKGNELGGCIATGNLESGFMDLVVHAGGSEPSSATHDCVARQNQGAGALLAGAGFFGIQTVTACTANKNAVVGIHILDGTCAESTTNGNFGNGILALQSSVTACEARHNHANGIEVHQGLCVNTVAHENGLGGAGSGIVAFLSTVANCQSNLNIDDGINAASTHIEGCNMQLNLGDGVEVLDSCYVWRNNVGLNGGDGIVAHGGMNTIEANHLTSNGLAAIDTLTFAGGFANAVLSNRETGNPAGYALDFGTNTWGEIYLGPTGVPIETFPLFGGDHHFANITY